MPAYLLHDDGELMWFETRVGDELHHITRGWIKPMERPADMIFWRERWYNVYLNYEADHATLRNVYCNVGLPPIITAQTISYVDLDLDVRFFPDGTYEVLDEDEFIEHTARYNYPEHIQQESWKAVEDLLTLWRNRIPPLDRLFNGATG
jgi:hypothetical protein